jgi:uncharacterized protein (DUF924 family)
MNLPRELKQILNYWFGDDYPDITYKDDYRHKSNLWFNINHESSEEMKRTFESQLNLIKNEPEMINKWLNEIENDESLKDTLTSQRARLSILILSSQIRQHAYRGTPQMFPINFEVFIKIGRSLIDDTENFSKLSFTEKFFTFFIMLDMGSSGKEMKESIEDLAANSPKEQRSYFIKYAKTANYLYDILNKFQRYPNRNQLFNLQSSDKEKSFLSKSRPGFTNLVIAPRSRPSNIKVKTEGLTSQQQFPYQKILFLHGYRQNSHKIKQRLQKLVRLLKINYNAHITFLNGTHPYIKPGNPDNNQYSLIPDEEKQNFEKLKEDFTQKSSQFNAIEAQRVWYNTNNEQDHGNGVYYYGIEESMAYVLSHVKHNGPYNGVMGFSQGSILASLLIQKYNLFQYFISISGFTPTPIKYSTFFDENQKIDIPSLHIYGERDILVKPQDSIKFAEFFNKSIKIKHEAGHFAPDSWPNKQIGEFISSHGEILLEKFQIKPEMSVETIVSIMNESLLRDRGEIKNYEIFFQSDEAKKVVKEEENEDLIKNLVEIKENKDILLVTNYLINKNRNNNDKQSQIMRYLVQFFKVKLTSNNDFLDEIIKMIKIIFIDSERWRELILLCDLAFDFISNRDQNGEYKTFD